jgi:hypothetical protein
VVFVEQVHTGSDAVLSLKDIDAQHIVFFCDSGNYILCLFVVYFTIRVILKRTSVLVGGGKELAKSETIEEVIKGKSRYIPKNTGLALWAKSAGRCQICGKKLYENDKFRIEVNISQKAHIFAFSGKGPRYSEDTFDVHSIDNLMLLCYEDHHTIDNDPEQFPVDVLRKLKADFERKVESVIDTVRKKSSVIYYSSSISEFDSSPKTKSELNRALLDANLFSDGNYFPIEIDNQYVIQDEQYFQTQMKALKKKMDRITSSLEEAEVVSVFGLAPQPLLMHLGYLLNDETDIRVFQKFRSKESGWSWLEEQQTNTFRVDRLFDYDSSKSAEVSEVNLIISVSAEIAVARIHGVKSADIPTYVLRSADQGLDAIKSEKDANDFIRTFRGEAIEQIRQDFPQASIINLFPAMPVSLPVRIGMNYLKNVDVEWRMYNPRVEDGFVCALSIKGGN